MALPKGTTLLQAMMERGVQPSPSPQILQQSTPKAPKLTPGQQQALLEAERRKAAQEERGSRPSAPVTQGVRGRPQGVRLQQLLQRVAKDCELEANAEELVAKLVLDFASKVCSTAAELATHRGSETVEVKDLQLCLKKHWQLKVPGLEEPKIRRRSLDIRDIKASAAKKVSPSNVTKRKAPGDGAIGAGKKQRLS